MALIEILEQPSMPGLKGGLIDEEGFPRADIDITYVRTMRGRIACLKTDLIAIVKQHETAMYDLHALYIEHGMVNLGNGQEEEKKN